MEVFGVYNRLYYCSLYSLLQPFLLQTLTFSLTCIWLGHMTWVIKLEEMWHILYWTWERSSKQVTWNHRIILHCYHLCYKWIVFLSHSPIWKLQQEPIAFRDQLVIILHREKQKEAFNHFLFSKSLWKEVTTVWSNWLFKLHPLAWLRLGRCFVAASYSLCRCHFAYSNCNVLRYGTHTWTPQSYAHHS